jgi:uncharacterized protein (DUF1501 family)
VTRHLEGTAGSGLRGVAMSFRLPTTLRGAPSTIAMNDIVSTQRNAAGTGDLATGGALLRRMAGTGPVGDLADATIAAVRELATVDVAHLPTRNGAAYANDPFSAQLRDVSRLLQSGIGLDAAVVDLTGWDMHAAMGSAGDGLMHDRLSMLGQALAAFDADTAGLPRPVTTVLMSEFGRRVTQNDAGGTDHGHGGVMMVLGDGVNGGVYGSWPGLADGALEDGDVPVTTDFRSVLGEVVARRLGNPDLATVFPGTSPQFLGLTKS